MNLALKIAGVIVLGAGIGLPIHLQAQTRHSSASNAAPALNEQQKAGQSLFMRNCSFCHLPRKEGNPKNTAEGSSFGPSLNGLMRGPKAASEAVVRTFIMRGSADKMPGFQYALGPKEIDSVIAYLKTL